MSNRLVMFLLGGAIVLFLNYGLDLPAPDTIERYGETYAIVEVEK